MNTLLIDIETRSDVPIAECGSYKYIEDASFDILLFAYSVDGAPARVVDFTALEFLPREIEDAIYDPSVRKLAWNCPFERTAIAKHFGRYCDPEEWTDVMILAASCGLPLNLDACCTAIGLPEDKAKLKVGKALIREFCCPVKPTRKFGMADHITPEMDAENWELFKEYCARDVDSENEIYQLLRLWTPNKTEHDIWVLDARINEKGIRADLMLAENAMQLDAKYKEELTDKAIGITGLSNPSSVAQVKAWLQEQEGIEVPTLNKKAVADITAVLKTEDAKQFMAIRSELSKTSTKKYDAFIRCACADEHIKGAFQFFGGHTGRWAGRLVQLQNLPQNHMADLDEVREIVRDGDYGFLRSVYPSVTNALSELIRTTLIPEEGHQFVVADFSAIEARVSAWLCGEEWVLESFRKGKDIYCSTASMMFGVPVEKHGVNSELRAKGKIATLACGYGGGVGSLKAFGADKMGLSNEDMAGIIDAWRKANPHIAASWKSINNAVIRCITRKESAKDRVTGTRFRYEKGILWMSLPSGREMAYYDPKYEQSQFNRGEMVISYMGMNQIKHKWQRIETRGSRIFENLVQATARDCLRDTMLRLDAAGWDIRGHIHDEVICSEPIGGRGVEEMCAVFSEPITWAPGLPLSGAGYTCPSYRKD